MLKTFWTGRGGWADKQLPDATVVWASPSGRTYTTKPGGALFFPILATPTGEITTRTLPAEPEPYRGVMMPRRARTRFLYWPTGNPFPDTDGSDRKGDNLYTNCIVALDPKTGALRWHFQFTPHDLHDWDAVQPPVLVDAAFHGRPRKLLLHADRNGFYYVLDRTNGELLLAKAFARKISWASGIDAKGRPVELPGNVPTADGTPTCPDIRGAANWMSTAYNPATGLYYVMTIENCGMYRSTQFGLNPRPAGRGWKGGDLFSVPGNEPPRRYLRAIQMETGKIAWEVEQKVPTLNYGGVLSTAGGVVFYSESSGGFAAVDAQTGRTLWHFETGQPPKASPMTYLAGGRQYVAIASGANILAFALPGAP